jgi:hypothetical protein
MSMLSCHAKISVRPASHQHCATTLQKQLQQERRRASKGMGSSAEELLREKRDLLLQSFYTQALSDAPSLRCVAVFFLAIALVPER